MDFLKITSDRIEELKKLHIRYKKEIGEQLPADENFESLGRAIENGRIFFYGCDVEGALVACCSVTPIYSTFDYKQGGVFEDFYILPEYRHQGIARKLVDFAYKESGSSSMIVGCADCDIGMYMSLGFKISLGNMLAFEN